MSWPRLAALALSTTFALRPVGAQHAFADAGGATIRGPDTAGRAGLRAGARFTRSG
ncbi:MAG: hypothetical protein IPJ56_05080 [Gemmatimonadetes bacterium]|nr:hypothetical protein [Gemmatimonadota bacterium]